MAFSSLIFWGISSNDRVRRSLAHPDYGFGDPAGPATLITLSSSGQEDWYGQLDSWHKANSFVATVADARNGGPEASLCKCVRAGIPTIGLKCLLAGGG